MDEQARYDRARKRVEELREFYRHLVTYLVVNAFLFVLNKLTSPGHDWFIWPLLGWGIGIVIHAASVFGIGRLWGEGWEERKIQEIMDKDRHGPRA